MTFVFCTIALFILSTEDDAKMTSECNDTGAHQASIRQSSKKSFWSLGHIFRRSSFKGPVRWLRIPSSRERQSALDIARLSEHESLVKEIVSLLRSTLFYIFNP